jgi:hypothetical protein
MQARQEKASSGSCLRSLKNKGHAVKGKYGPSLWSGKDPSMGLKGKKGLKGAGSALGP